MSGFLKLLHKSECLGARILSTFDVKCRFAQTVYWILPFSDPDQGTFFKILSTVKYRFVTTVKGIPSLSFFSGVVLFIFSLSFHCHYMSRGPMSICQTVTRDSAKSEAARGRLTRPLEHDFEISKHHHHRTLSWRRHFTQYGCGNNLQDFFIPDVGTGGPRVSGLQLQ